MNVRFDTVGDRPFANDNADSLNGSPSPIEPLETTTEPLQIARAVVQVLRDSALKQRLVEGVCDLLLEDARLQQERSRA